MWRLDAMPNLIVFDLDGTLVDSRLDLADSANALLAEFDHPALPVEQVAAMVGDGARKLVARVLGAAGVAPNLDEALSRFLAIYDRHLLVHTRVYAGVADVVRDMSSRAVLAILTNKPAHHTERLLEGLDLREPFTSVIGGDSGYPRKPDPAALRHLISQHHALPATTLMVGDSMVDLETGRRAGTIRCGVGYGFAQFRDGLVLETGELYAESPADLGPLLRAFVDGRA